MQTKIISTLIGIIIVLSTGSVVYIEKKSKDSSNIEDVENTETVVDGVSQSVSSDATAITKVTKKYEREDDEDEDDYRGGNTGTTTTSAPTSTPTPSTPTTTSGITMTQISSHNSRSSCWSAINGGVYDLTSWIPNHPGGEQTILSICGIDGSSRYNGQHGSSSKPARILAGFKIGTLSN